MHFFFSFQRLFWLRDFVDWIPFLYSQRVGGIYSGHLSGQARRYLSNGWFIVNLYVLGKLLYSILRSETESIIEIIKPSLLQEGNTKYLPNTKYLQYSRKYLPNNSRKTQHLIQYFKLVSKLINWFKIWCNTNQPDIYDIYDKQKQWNRET